MAGVALNYLTSALNDGFCDVVWTDESSVQLETHRRHSYRKVGHLPKPKPRYSVHDYYMLLQYSTKVHVWAGISWNGATPIVIFEGKMDAEGFVAILQEGLLPFLKDTYLSEHRLMQYK